MLEGPASSAMDNRDSDILSFSASVTSASIGDFDDSSCISSYAPVFPVLLAISAAVDNPVLKEEYISVNLFSQSSILVIIHVSSFSSSELNSVPAFVIRSEAIFLYESAFFLVSSTSFRTDSLISESVIFLYLEASVPSSVISLNDSISLSLIVPASSSIS